MAIPNDSKKYTYSKLYYIEISEIYPNIYLYVFEVYLYIAFIKFQIKKENKVFTKIIWKTFRVIFFVYKSVFPKIETLKNHFSILLNYFQDKICIHIRTLSIEVSKKKNKKKKIIKKSVLFI